MILEKPQLWLVRGCKMSAAGRLGVVLENNWLTI
jgi:hypothetical protein